MKKSEQKKVRQVEALVNNRNFSLKKACKQIGINIAVFRKLRKKVITEERKKMAKYVTTPKIEEMDFDVQDLLDDMDNTPLSVTIGETTGYKRKYTLPAKANVTREDIVEIIKNSGLTEKEFCEKCNLSHSTLHRFPMTEKTYQKIISVFPLNPTPVEEENEEDVVSKPESIVIRNDKEKVETYASLKTKCSTLERNIGTLNNLNKSLHEENEQLKKEYEELLNANAILDSKNKTLIMETNSLKVRVEKLKNQGDLEAIKEENERYKKMIDHLLK